jgi:hypothetical protein
MPANDTRFQAGHNAMARTIKLVAAGAAVALVVAGCGVGPDKSREDAQDTQNVDKTAPHVTAFNNHFPSVEDKCDGNGHRVFVATHDSSTGRNFIVIADPSCTGYAATTGANGAGGDR